MIPALLLALSLAPASAEPASGGASARDAQAEYLRGTLLERGGSDAEALAAYEKALELDPAAAFIAGEAAELALRLEDRGRAEKWARRRLELAPNDARSRVILGRVLWARGDVEKAEEQFQKALRTDPASADVFFSLAELVAGRDPKRARRLLEESLKARPEHAARAYFELGRLDAQEERYPAAIERLKRSIGLDDAESLGPRLALAQVYEITRATAAAVEEYRKVLADDPDDVDLWAHVGGLEAAMGAREQARDTFRRLKERHPGNAAACAWLAADAERAGDFKAAAAALADSDALKDDPTANLRLGYYQLQADGLREALKTLAEARRRWPKDDRIAYYLALGRDDAGDHGEAVALLRSVLASKPEDRDARWQLAVILERTGRLAEAEPEFRRLIADKPDDAPALNYLGYALADAGTKLPEAEELVRRALLVEPANPAYRDSLGWALHRQGRSAEAVKELAAAAAALPGDGSVRDHLGDARAAAGDRQGAWRAWRAAQLLGARGAAAKADKAERALTPEEAGDLWRAHLEAAHGGVRRFAAVCSASGKVAGRALERKALLDYREGTLSLEILGPLFSPVASARLGPDGFSMDRLPVEGLDEDRAGAAVEGALAAVRDVLSGAAFAEAPARLRRGWWGRRRLSVGPRVIELDGAAAKAVSAEGQPSLVLTAFSGGGARRVPRSFAASGPFWSLALDCADPKIE